MDSGSFSVKVLLMGQLERPGPWGWRVEEGLQTPTQRHAKPAAMGDAVAAHTHRASPSRTTQEG